MKNWVLLVLPVGVMGAWETEIPRHDFIGYMKIEEILAVGFDDNACAIVSDSVCVLCVFC